MDPEVESTVAERESEGKEERKKEKLVMLITESGKSEVVLGGARRETGGGRNSNMRNGNSERNGRARSKAKSGERRKD